LRKMIAGEVASLQWRRKSGDGNGTEEFAGVRTRQPLKKLCDELPRSEV
jgi:hypothetical protein